MKHFTNYKLLIISIAIGLFGFSYAQAALLYTGSAQQVVYQNQTFVVEWFIDTQNVEINSIQLKLKFNPELLEVVDTNVGTSALNVWVKPPTADNVAGTIEMVGGVSGGVKSQKTSLFSATFNPKQTGAVQIIMDESSVILLADGQGTQAPLLFKQLGFTIQPEAAIPAKIVSSTHPDSNAWYKDNNVEFTFTPKEGDVYSYSFSTNLEIIPDDKPDELKDKYQYLDLPDGVYYFKVNSRTGNGNWIEAGVYRVQIDKTPPEEFLPAVAADGAVFEGQPFVSFATADKVSGVSYYEIKFGLLGRWVRADGTYFKLPGLVLGDKIEVKAVDAAGNEQISVINVDKTLVKPWFKSSLLWGIIIGGAILAYAAFWFYRRFVKKYQI